MSGAIGGLLGALGDVKEKVIATAAAAKATIVAGLVIEEGREILDAVMGGKTHKPLELQQDLVRELLLIVGAAEEAIGTPVFEALIGSTVNKADLSSTGQAHEAVAMVKKFLGFGMALPLAASAVKSRVEMAFGGNAPTGLLEAIEKIPEELGVNFFLGTVIERVFEEAVSEPLGEAIREAYRPTRLEVQQVIRLLKTKDLPEAQADVLLKRAGIRDEDLHYFKAFGRTLLPVGDIQQAFLHGLITEDVAQTFLEALGLDPADATLARQIYLEKALIEGGNVYRSVARQAFIESFITEDMFRAILNQVNIPPPSIDLEVEALNLQKDIGKAHLGVATIKALFEHGDITQAETTAKLSKLGYSAEDAASIIQTWGESSKKGHAGISEGRVLSYLVSGVLTKAEAYDRLVQLGIAPADAQLLVEHPRATAGKMPHALSASTIVAAFKDGTLTSDAAMAKLVEIGKTQEEAQLEIDHAAHVLSRARKPKGAAKALTEGEIIAAYAQGLVETTWLHDQLVTFGYAESDAQLLVATEYARVNKAVPPGWVTLN